MAAEVGLLTRNVKIIGNDYPKLQEQAFGARTLVGKYLWEDGAEQREYIGEENVFQIFFQSPMYSLCNRFIKIIINKIDNFR